MGMFKDVRGLSKQAKDLQKSAGVKRPSLSEGLQQASAAMADAQEQIDLQQHLAANGTSASAVIEAVRPTEMLVNQMPVLEYDLRLQLPEGESSVTRQQVTPHAYLGQLVPGASVNVVVDLADRDKVMLVFG